MRELLNCFGHYGYGTGWKEGIAWCDNCCPSRSDCLEKVKRHGLIDAVEVNKNICDGRCDRTEGQSRYTGGEGSIVVHSNPHRS